MSETLVITFVINHQSMH